MSRSTSYIPAAQGAYAEFTEGLYTKLTADPPKYGATADQLIPFATAYEAFAAAYAEAINPETRTGPKIEAKDDARDRLTAEIRPLIQVLQRSSAMTNEKRRELAIPVIDAEPTPVPLPATAPLILVQAVKGNVIDVELRDEADPDRRAKPAGVKGATLFHYIGDVPPDDVAGWTFNGNVTKTNTKVEVPASVAPGSQVWLIGFWFNTKAQSGPASVAVSTYVQGVQGGLQSLRKAA